MRHLCCTLYGNTEIGNSYIKLCIDQFNIKGKKGKLLSLVTHCYSRSSRCLKNIRNVFTGARFFIKHLNHFSHSVRTSRYSGLEQCHVITQ